MLLLVVTKFFDGDFIELEECIQLECVSHFGRTGGVSDAVIDVWDEYVQWFLIRMIVLKHKIEQMRIENNLFVMR